MRFRDRVDAGCHLADLVRAYADRPDVLVLGLPRGGVPVAAEIAARLHAPLDVWLVRKLGAPGYSELAMGAIASGGVEIVNADVIDALEIPLPLLHEAAARERVELERRERAYRGDRSTPTIRGHVAILVDDGLATGSTMEAAIRSVRQLEPSAVIVAVPVGARDTCDRLRPLAEQLVCVHAPEVFRAVGEFYGDFSQTTDEEVRRALESAKELRPPQA
jgi:predicted phosphoribosyltransferase